MNTSATGGPLVPTLPDSVALRRFFQGLIKGVTGLPGDMVRPRWQANPPPRPSVEVDWCGFDIASRTPDANAHMQQLATTAKQTRHEQLEIKCSFYGPNCQGYGELLRDGLEVSQNREPLLLAGMGYVESANFFHLPELINDQYYERFDFSVFVNREVGKVYQILPFSGAIGAIITELLTLPFEVNP